nr:helix-turn-helix transcriptional regulator [uncultured Pseudodesulfovibrio sp.]
MSRSAAAGKAISPAAVRTLEKVGANIKKARLRRNITQKDLARRASTNHVTLGKLERGEPTVGLGVLVQVLEILGLLSNLELLANPNDDQLGVALEEKNQRQRAGSKRNADEALDF